MKCFFVHYSRRFVERMGKSQAELGEAFGKIYGRSGFEDGKK